MTPPISVQTGIFFASFPYEDREQGAELREAGWRFHWGRSSGKCHPKCMACAKRLDADRVWYTPDIPKVLRFREQCDERAIEVIQRAELALEQSRATDATIDVPAPPGLALFGYQRAGVAWMLRRRAALLGDEQGIGKTIQTIGAINAEPKIRSVLIVVPATLVINWCREIRRWSVRPTRIVIPKSADEVPAPADQADPTVCIVLTNYEKIVEGRGKSKHDDWDLHRRLMDRRWDLLVVDEAQRLRGRDSAWTRAVLGVAPKGRGDKRTPRVSGLAHRADRRWLLTGTPMPNRPVELWPMLSSLAPATFHNFLGFARRYCGAHKTEMGQPDAPNRKSFWRFDGASNLDELQAVLRAGTEHGGFMIRRLKSEVLPDLPPKIRHLHVLEPTTQQAAGAIASEWAKYRPAQEQIEALRAGAAVAEMRNDADGYARAVAALEKAERVAFNRISTEREALARAKAPLVVEYLTCLLDGGLDKVTVFGMHYSMIDALVAGLQSYGVAKIDGRTPQNQRMQQVDKFQSDPGCRVFVGNVQSAGVGLNLTAASTIVLSEPSWVPGENLQAEDRGHRIGAEHECVNAVYLVLNGSLDQRVLEVLVTKMAVQHEALDAKQGQPVTPSEGAPLREVAVYADEVRQTAQRVVRALDARQGGSTGRRGTGLRDQWRTTGQWLARQEQLGDQGTAIVIELARWHRAQIAPADLAVLGIEPEPPSPKTAPVRRRRAPQPPSPRPGYESDNLPYVLPGR